MPVMRAIGWSTILLFWLQFYFLEPLQYEAQDMVRPENLITIVKYKSHRSYCTVPQPFFEKPCDLFCLRNIVTSPITK